MQNRYKHGWFFSLLLLICAFLSGQTICLAKDVPQLGGRVNDNASMLSAASIEILDKQLAELEATDSTQIVLLTVDSLEGESVDGYAMQVVEAWKIGQQQFDNGALLLIAKNDKKIRIEVGYGLEGTLTDLISGRIIDGIITPAFKVGRFDQGIVAGVEAMIATVKGEYSSENLPAGKSKAEENDPGGIIAVLMFAFIFMKGIARKHSLVAVFVGAVVTPIAGFLFGFTAWPMLLFFSGLGAIIALIAGMSPNSSVGRSLRTGRSFGGRSGRSSGRSSNRFGGGGGGFGGGGASGGW